jgi:hypothetical protein
MFYSHEYNSLVLPGIETTVPLYYIRICKEVGVKAKLYGTNIPIRCYRTDIICAARSSAIRDASDFVDLCALSGYLAEEHVVQTSDGYLLGLHRLGWKRGEEGVKVNSSKGGIKKPVVYLHHGLLMNSEVWVCLTDEERCLPFHLVEKGYDVWVCVSYFIVSEPC